MDVINTSVSFLLNHMRQNEHVKAHEDVLERIKPDAEQIPEVKAMLDEYEAGVERLTLIFKHSPESPETKHIAGYDNRRGELWMVCKRIIKVCLNSFDPAVRTAAYELGILMDAYGNVPRFSLYGETGSLEHALNELKKPENQAKVALIPGFSALTGELETVNNALDILYKQRLEEAETVKLLGKLGDCLPLMDKQLITLFRALNAVYYYNEMTAKLPALRETIEHIALNAEALFDQLKKILDRRGIKASGKKL